MATNGAAAIADRPTNRIPLDSSATQIELYDEGGTAKPPKAFRAVSLAISASAAGVIQFVSGSTVIFTWNFLGTAPAPLVLPFNLDGWFEHTRTDALKIVNDTGIRLTGTINYIKM